MQAHVKENTGLKYIKGLDSLRALAVILVIIGHWGPFEFKSSAVLTVLITKVLPAATFGVDVFFVLSGYLITNILLNARKNIATGGKLHIIKTFYIRRTLRIFPIYFLVVFTLLFIGSAEVRQNIGYFLTYTSDFLIFKQRYFGPLGHTWSLSVEEQFYLVWPWFIIFTPSKYLPRLITCFIFAGCVCSTIFSIQYGYFSFILPFCCIQAFSIGALLACGQQGLVSQKSTDKIFLWLLGPALILLAFFQFGVPMSFIRLINSIIAYNIISYTIKQKYNRFTGAVLNNRVLNYVGKISYGIYLYHFLIPGYMNEAVDHLNARFRFSDKTLEVLKGPVPAYIIHLFLLLLIATLSYYFFETRITKLKTRLPYVSSTARLRLSSKKNSQQPTIHG